MRDIVIASAQFVHQHDNVRRPGESHRGAGRKKKTTNPKLTKIHVCLKQFFRVFTDLLLNLFSVGLSFPFKPSGVFNLHLWLSPSGLRSTRLSFLRCSSNSEKRFLHALLCLIPGASIPLSHAGQRRVGSKRTASGEVLSELSGLPTATSAVSAGDVGDGQTLETALLELPVESQQPSV